MKFLLVAINAKYIHSNLAVYSLKAYAEKYGNNQNKIEIRNYTINQYEEEILQDIYESGADAIGFSCYIWNIDMVKNIINDYKKICPKVHIWVGGPEVSYNAKAFLEENPKVDFVMYGEGEATFKQVIDSYVNQINDADNTDFANQNTEIDNFANINGLAYRRENKIEINPPMTPVDLSEIPFVYKDMDEFKNRIIYYEASRGCPFSCSYCLSSIDKTIRFRNLDLVKEELQIFLDNKVAQVKFVDRTFNCNKNRTMEIWKFINDHDNGVTNFHFEIAADLIVPEQIELISTMRPGLIQLEIGVQSFNKQTLGAINRKTDLEKIKEATKKIKAGRNIHQHLDLIVGLPYEDYDSFKDSFNQIYELKPDQLQIGFLKVLHGSMMEYEASKYNIVYSDKSPYQVLSTEWLSYEQVLRLMALENAVEIYYNSNQFENTMAALEDEFDTAFDMYEKLGQFYKNNSPNGKKHARIDRYNLLLQYIRENNCEKHNYEYMLTLDFYLRENAKTRPAFAKDLSEHKTEIRNIFLNEKIRDILPDYSQYTSKQMEKMTHVEVDDGGRYLLFDYQNRSPLNHQADVIDVTEYVIREEKEM